MHLAPAASCQVGSTIQTALWGGAAWAMALVLLTSWLVHAYPIGLLGAVALGACLASGTAAVVSWLRMPQGQLFWDGAQWFHATGDQRLAGQIVVELDLQKFLLVRFQPLVGQRRKLWMVFAGAGAEWISFRRAALAPHQTPEEGHLLDLAGGAGVSRTG